MYMGQQSWGQAGQQSWQQQAAQQAQQQAAVMQQQQQQQQQRSAGADVGNAQRIRIAGCKHEVVGPIISGDYSISGSNHGKPSYKKDAASNGLQVMMYFWDERDGAASSGWWIGPQVGGNMVWGHHPNRTTGTPPTSGWQAPHSAPADPAMSVTAITAAPANGQQQWRQQGQQQQWNQQQGQQQQQQNWKQNNWQQGWQQGGGNQQNNWQQQGNQWNQRPQQQQWKEQADEQNRKRLEEQKARMEAQRGQQNELQRKRMEEQQRRMEEMKRQQEEQNAVRTIRTTIGKLRAVTAETFETIKSELAEVLAREFDSCGSQKTKIQEESDKALEAASARLEKIKEMDAKRKEAMEKAQESLEQLIEMAEGVEASSKSFAEGVAEFVGLPALDSEEKVNSAAAAIEDLGKDASEKVDAALEFIKAKGQEVRILTAAGGSKALLKPQNAAKKVDGTAEEEKEPEAAPKPTWIQLQHKIGTCKTSVDKESKALKNAVEAALKKAAAQDEWKKIQATFAKYDKDKDGFLNRKEIALYAKTEFSFKLSEANLDQVFKVMVINGDKGVKEADLQRLKASVGIAREMVRDQERKKEREEREAELAKKKAKFQVKINEVAEVIKAADTEIQEFAQLTKSIMTEGRTMKAVEMVAKAAELDVVVEKATAKVAEANKEHAGLTATAEGVEKELATWFEIEKKKLANQIKTAEGNMAKSNVILNKFRDDATKKDSQEVKQLSAKVLQLLKAHQKEAQLSIVALFSTIDAKDKGTIDQDSFVKYLSKISEEKAGEDKKGVLSEEEIGRVFVTFDEEKEGEISQDTFKGIMRVMMKVMKDVAITETFEIKDTKTVRRLDVGEVIEVVDGPRKEEATDVTRVHARAMTDGAEGWVTTEGNHGTVFLKEGGNLFKVVRDTILTECFQIDASKEESRKVKESTRKLKAGEVLEVREWGRTQEDTGLTRMKCKVRSDGMVGYVTTVGNTGIKFVEAI